MNYYNYFTEIEEAFVRRRGKNLLLSPIDWAMIESWQERGVPLHIVIRGIESVFDSFDKKPSARTIKGLLYCREEIEAQYQEWLAMNAGKAAENGDDDSAVLSREDIAGHIAGAIDSLKQIKDKKLSDEIGRACSRLAELIENLTDDPELTERSLADIERFLDGALLNSSDKSVLDEAAEDVKAQLKPYRSTMEPDAYKQTFDLMVLKKLRSHYEIPRLSLFYL